MQIERQTAKLHERYRYNVTQTIPNVNWVVCYKYYKYATNDAF